MKRRDEERLEDIEVAIDVIRQHLKRGDLNDGLVVDAVRVRLIEIGEAVRAIDPQLLATEPDVPWHAVMSMRNQLAHHYFDTPHAILHSTIEENVPMLARAVGKLKSRLMDSDE